MEEKNLIAFADVLTNLCVDVMRDYTGIVLPHDVMAEIIGASDHLMEDLYAYYNAYSMNLDTFTRDDLFDAVGKRFTSLGRWPLNMDNEEVSEAFIEELAVKVREAGGQIVSRDKPNNIKSHGGKVL